MKYIYSLYDAKTGELAYKGKAGQLVADGVFSRSDDLSRLWAKQHLKGIRPRKWKVEREEIRPVAKKIAPPGGTTRKVWVYRMTDADGRWCAKAPRWSWWKKAFLSGQRTHRMPTEPGTISAWA